MAYLDDQLDANSCRVIGSLCGFPGEEPISADARLHLILIDEQSITRNMQSLRLQLMSFSPLIRKTSPESCF